MPTLPTVTVPSGFTGNWTPPSNYGNLISPPINLTPQDWVGIPAGIQGAAVAIQFATDKGQQIGHIFFLYDSYIGPPGVQSGQPGCGFLGNPKTFEHSKLEKAGVAGMSTIFEESVMGPHSWPAIMGQPYVELLPPSAPSGESASQVFNDVQNSLNKLRGMLNL